MKQEIDAILPDGVKSKLDPTYYLCIQCVIQMHRFLKLLRNEIQLSFRFYLNPI